MSGLTSLIENLGYESRESRMNMNRESRVKQERSLAHSQNICNFSETN